MNEGFIGGSGNAEPMRKRILRTVAPFMLKLRPNLMLNTLITNKVLLRVNKFNLTQITWITASNRIKAL